MGFSVPRWFAQSVALFSLDGMQTPAPDGLRSGSAMLNIKMDQHRHAVHFLRQRVLDNGGC